MTDYKLPIIDALDALRKKSIMDKEPFRARAYQTVITQLKSMPTFTKQDLPLLNGAGEKITAKIKEIMETGSLASAEIAKQTYHMDAIAVFQNIYGVGPVKAASLIDQGITSIDALRAALVEKPDLLNKKQTVGLLYYDALLQRIPFQEMKEHETILLDAIGTINRCAVGTVVGSFRRGAADSGDIDLLVKGGIDMMAVVAALGGYLVEILALGKNKCMAICSLGIPRRLDILIAPEEEYAYSLLYFTGSQQFNIAFRGYANACGYTMNEHGMTPLGNDMKPPIMKTEQDIFQFLGLQYVPPHLRVDGNQLLII